MAPGLDDEAQQALATSLGRSLGKLLESPHRQSDRASGHGGR